MRGVRTAAALAIALLLSGCAAPSPRSAAAPQAAEAAVGAVQGSVVREDLTPIEGVLVELEPGAVRAFTDERGRFSFPGLDPGPYVFEANHEKWEGVREVVHVVAGETTELTAILAPKSLAGPRKTVTRLDGVLTCAVVGAMGAGTDSLTCSPIIATLSLGPSWSASVTEVTWGENGTSSTPDSVVTLRPASGSGAYARREGASPIRIQLTPGQIHGTQGGTAATPPQGAMVLELRKEPTRLLSDVRLGVTLREGFHIYHTTFYGAVPQDLDAYSARA